MNSIRMAYLGTAGGNAVAPGASSTPRKCAVPAVASLRLKMTRWWSPGPGACRTTGAVGFPSRSATIVAAPSTVASKKTWPVVAPNRSPTWPPVKSIEIVLASQMATGPAGSLKSNRPS